VQLLRLDTSSIFKNASWTQEISFLKNSPVRPRFVFFGPPSSRKPDNCNKVARLQYQLELFVLQP